MSKGHKTWLLLLLDPWKKLKEENMKIVFLIKN